MREGYWVWSEDDSERVWVDANELDPELLDKLRARPALGGFCYPADDFMDLPLSEVPYYIGGGWLPQQGKALFYAPAKMGKSYFALHLARCIGAGEDFLGLPVSQGRVLYLQFELGIKVLQDRMKSTGQAYPEVFVGTNFSLKLPNGKKQLVDALDAVKPKVLILDPLYKALKGDENLEADIMPILDMLDEIIESYECSVIIIDHTGKDRERGARGSSVKEDWVDSYLEIRRISKKGDPLRVSIIPQALRHAELPPEPVVAQLDSNFEFALVTHEDEPTTLDKVAGALSLAKTMAAKDIVLKCGRRQAVYAALGKLIEEGKVEKKERGVYEWKGG